MPTKYVRLVAALIIIAGIVGNSGIARAQRSAMPQVKAPDLIPPASSLGVQFVHIATAENTTNASTIIDHPLTNGNPNAIIIVTPNWDPGGYVPGVYDDHPIGVWYVSGMWRIVNQDSEPMPVGAAFNVLIPTAGANVFVHTATAGNVSTNHTFIDNSLTNSNPNAILFITPNYDPGPTCPCIFPNSPTGVYFDSAVSKWAIFNENSAAMPVDASFNVFILSAGAGVFVHKAAFTTVNTTIINYALTNYNPNEIVFVTPNWDPGGAGGTYDNHNIGVSYTPEIGLWTIFNQDGATMPTDAAFNVLVLVPASDVLIHKATTPNTVGNATLIDNAQTNSHANAIAFVTSDWNPGGVGGVYNNHNLGLWYSSGTWRILNQDLVDMPVGAAFNTMIPDPDANVFVHRASAVNITLNDTLIDHPLTNGHPNAIILVTPNFNPGGVGGTYNNHSIGVWYTGGMWRIFNQDSAAMPVGAAFNVFVPTAGQGVFVHTATTENIIGYNTRIDNGLTHDNPYAIVLVTPNYDPGGLGGTFDDHPLGVYYNSIDWNIFNQDHAAMPVGAAFNVYVYVNRIYLPALMH